MRDGHPEGLHVNTAAGKSGLSSPGAQSSNADDLHLAPEASSLGRSGMHKQSFLFCTRLSCRYDCMHCVNPCPGFLQLEAHQNTSTSKLHPSGLLLSNHTCFCRLTTRAAVLFRGWRSFQVPLLQAQAGQPVLAVAVHSRVPEAGTTLIYGSADRDSPSVSCSSTWSQ